MTTTPPPDAGQPEIVWVLCYILRFPNEPREWAQAFRKAYATEKEAEAGRTATGNPTGYSICRVELRRAPLAPPREVTEADAALRRANRELARMLITGGVNSEYSVQDLTQYYEDLIDAIESRHSAALNAPERVDDWRPIETEPGDGNPVLLWFPDDRSMWSARAQASGGWVGMCDYGLRRDSHVEGRTPSHWMPWPEPPDLSEMRDIRGGEVGEITRTPEEQAALERAMVDVVPNPNALPKEMLPANVRFSTLTANLTENGEEFTCVLEKLIPVEPWGSIWAYGEGPTPRAAMIAAIEAALERATGDVGKP